MALELGLMWKILISLLQGQRPRGPVGELLHMTPMVSLKNFPLLTLNFMPMDVVIIWIQKTRLYITCFIMVASFKMLFWQVFLVSGGRSSRSIEHWDNTELMVEGLSWQQVASAKLPWPMGLFRIVSFDNKIFATGENHLWMLYVVLKTSTTA